MNRGPKDPKASGKQGGDRRAEVLTPARRKEISSKAIATRWANDAVAQYQGVLQIGNKKVACAVLKDGRRMIMQNDFMILMGRSPRGFEGGLVQADASGLTSISAPPPFLAAANLQPFISEDLRQCLTPVKFRTMEGRAAIGYQAILLPKVCSVYLDARRDGVMQHTQANAAAMCEIIMQALAHVGIAALVDEATGYQYDRAREALQLLLKTYIAEDLLPATRRFSHEFLQGAYRLCGWEYSEGVPIKAHLLGTLINRTIYEKLPPEVLDEIRKMNPVKEASKRRKYRQHQLLSEGTGIAHLDKLLAIATAFMSVFPTREQFFAAYDKAVPAPPRILDLAHEEQDPKEGLLPA